MNVIKNIKITDIVPNKGQVDGLPKNPRFIKDYRFEALKKSISDAPEMLSLRELIVFPFNGKYVTLCGNMRLRACKELGFKEVPCKVLDEQTPADKLREYTIKDNNAFGDTDFDLLANEWDTDELGDWGVEFPNLDFDEDTTEGTTEEPTAEEDDFDEDAEQIEARVQKEDIWQLGDHRLMCGDSTIADDVARLMNGELADLWLTDPPYNVAYVGGTGLTIQNDNMTDTQFRQFLHDSFSAAYNIMRQGASFYIWFNTNEHMNFEGALNDVGLQVRQELVWNKNTFVLGRKDYQQKHEPCLYGWKDGGAHQWYSDRKQTTVLNFDKPMRNADHPTMKPLPLFGYQIQNSSKEGDIVLDTFGGSGTTLIACEQLNRKCYIMELDPHYCDVIIARWEKLTGQKAERISNG